MTNKPSSRARHRSADEVRALGLHTDVATAAEILGVSRSTAYELIRREEFPVTVLRLGSLIRVPVEPLAALFDGSTSGTGS